MRTMRCLAIITALLAFTPAARAEVKTRELEYRAGDTVLQGFIAWDDAWTGKRPGVLVVHEWWGHNQHARNQAKRLAEAGYVGMALDLYGKGKVATHPADAQAFLAEATKDPAALGARFAAAREQLVQDPHVDPERIGAIGYCFGGAVVLSQARSGADLDAVASFHGAVGASAPARKGRIKARVLVMTGTADPLVPDEQVRAFEKEMKAAGARFEVIRYPGARHSFTNPDADQTGMEGLAYDADADRKSWAALLKLLHRVWR